MLITHTLDADMKGAAALLDTWIQVTQPTSAEIAYLRNDLHVPAVFIAHALDLHELARYDHRGNDRLIILRVPHFLGDHAPTPYNTIPLGVILTETHLVTISRFRVSVIDDLLHDVEQPILSRESLLLLILLETAKKYLEVLSTINGQIESAEDRLQLSLKNKEVYELLKYQKSLVHFTTGLKSNELLMQRLQKTQLLNSSPDDQELLADVLTENAQAIQMTCTSSDILSQMMDAFASIISNNLNVVMKFLTAFTVVLSFPTIFASIYGMNVGLPFAQSPFAFYGILLLSICTSTLVALVFWKRDWL
jgi:magnesium transporter